MFKVVGLRVLKKASKDLVEEFNEQYNEKIIDVYEFLLSENGKKYIQTIYLEEGMCYSGYCGSEWLHYTDPKEVEDFGTIHYIPKGNLEFYNIITDFDGNDFYTAYENDCRYYPSANLKINFNNWEETGRQKTKKQIYIFVGASSLGKSYIAHNTTLKVFETDAEQLFGLDESYDIIVAGNKHKITLEDIKNILPDVELIKVKFEEFQ